MPEVPEIASRAREMDKALKGKTFHSIEILQPKSLNMPPEEFTLRLSGAVISGVQYHGKWLQVDTSQGWLLINLGMGGEILLVDRHSLPAKRRLIFDFSDGTCLSINFWWFGYVHFTDAIENHTPSARLGPNVLDVSRGDFHRLTAGQRVGVKKFLLDQSRIAGIGNAYVHDILFLAKIHPLRRLDSLNHDEVDRLFDAIQDGLRPSLEKGGAFYEVDIYGQKGGFSSDQILVGYRENQPCPNCRTPIVKIRTGSTSSFLCPTCQPL